MDNLIVSVNVVIPLFALVALGYILTQTKFLSGDFNKVANKLCFYVALPVSIFKNIYEADFEQTFNINLIYFSVVMFFIVLAISVAATLLFTKNNAQRGVLIQCAVRSNYVYIGLPICEKLFGATGAAVASTLIPIAIPLYNVSAVMILSIFSDEKKIDFKKIIINILKNPLIIAAAAACVVKLAGISFPDLVETSVGDIAKLATPLALIALGGSFKFKSIGKQLAKIIYGVSARLLIVPVIAIISAVLLGFRNAELCAVMIMFASPVAVSSYPMAVQMKSDGELAGQLVVFTTAFSVVTLFIIIFILKTLGFL